MEWNWILKGSRVTSEGRLSAERWRIASRQTRFPWKEQAMANGHAPWQAAYAAMVERNIGIVSEAEQERLRTATCTSPGSGALAASHWRSLSGPA